ncbi:Phage-related minor tail protein (plasmid) [Streptomyces collinus Tu 365]|uniref:Phage-related minor tail protein n=2 Tax=Streptomyces collinus TaxID=42684 RepID=S5VSX7_STRC3|nr:Phage-related minor tail protein [Streptomyces collinus Tu 365]
MESGGNYKAHNPGGALGAYQVMPEHLAGGNEWAGRVFGHSVTPQQFLNSRDMQDQMARVILGGYYQKYGAAGAAAAWFSGSPDPNSNASDGNTTVRNYVRTVLALMAKAPAGGVGSSGSSVSDGVLTTGKDASAANATQASYKDDPKCLIGMDIPLVGGVCLLTKGQARAIEGALLLIAGGIIASGGLIILAAYGLKSSGALEGVAKAAQVIPGAGGVAAKAAEASGALKAGPSSSSARRSKANQEQLRLNRERRAAENHARRKQRGQGPSAQSDDQGSSSSGSKAGGASASKGE